MNLITFNVDDRLINFKDQKVLNKKKNLLFSYACQHNKEFKKKSKNKIANVFNFENIKEIPYSYKCLEKAYDETLTYLKDCLNKAHNKNYSKHYWEILVGKWLVTLIHQTFANWEILKKIKRKYPIKAIYKIPLSGDEFIPQNTWHAHILTRSSEYKYNLFHHWLLTEMSAEKKIKTINLRLKKNLNLKSKILKLSKPNKYHSIIYKSLNNKIFYYLWDVPREIKLKAMKYFKFINIFLKLKKFKINNSQKFDRKKIFIYKKKKSVNYKSFLIKIMKFTFPKIYLENYNTLEINYKKLNWPNNPKYILTSYPYYDELFKYYCAQKYETGSKILLTQHGSDNIYKYDNWHVNSMYTNQLCWGKYNKKGYHEFIFTKNYAYKKGKFVFSKNKKILLILYSFTEMENRSPEGYMDNMSINKRIFNSTSVYLNSLIKKLQKKNTVKALQLTRYPILENSLKKKHKNLKFIKIKEPFKKVIYKYNLSIHFYLGTPFFESLYLNRPAIIIFDEKTNSRFDNKFLYYLKEFKKLNICFESSHQAADFINKNYSNLENWWNSPKTQIIINKFRENFCRFSKNLDVEFERISKI